MLPAEAARREHCAEVKLKQTHSMFKVGLFQFEIGTCRWGQGVDWRSCWLHLDKDAASNWQGKQRPDYSDRPLHPAGRENSYLSHLLDSKDASQAAARPRAERNPVTILPALLAQPPAETECALWAPCCLS